MNAKNAYQVLDDISRERVNPHLNLMPGIQAKINQRRQSTIRLRLAVLALTLVLLVTIISQPTVASAYRS
jgi:hypothetical protein